MNIERQYQLVAFGLRQSTNLLVWIQQVAFLWLSKHRLSVWGWHQLRTQMLILVSLRFNPLWIVRKKDSAAALSPYHSLSQYFLNSSFFMKYRVDYGLSQILCV